MFPLEPARTDALRAAARISAALAASRLEDILARIERLASPTSPIGDGKSAKPAAAAVSVVLGGASKPQPKLSNLVEAHQKLAEDQAIGKSEKQPKQWQARHVRSVETLISPFCRRASHNRFSGTSAEGSS